MKLAGKTAIITAYLPRVPMVGGPVGGRPDGGPVGGGPEGGGLGGGPVGGGPALLDSSRRIIDSTTRSADCVRHLVL